MKIQAPPLERWTSLRGAIAAGALPVVDVRSPGEFARGRIPHAVNVPLLDDEERHLVGLTHKTEGSKPASRIGVELFAKKAERFLADVERSAAGRGRVAVHCWRGGVRSGFVGRWLAVAGIDAVVLEGGYKTYRQDVLDLLAELATKRFIVLDGRTGAGKSTLLRRLPGELPSLDFEALARHRGSAFGDFAQPAPPPTQQDFENELAEAYARIREAPLIVVEIETLLGPIILPEALRKAVTSAPTVVVERDFDDRVARLAAEYARDWGDAQDALFALRMRMLDRHLSNAQKSEILDAVSRRDFAAATAALLRYRYDRTYDKGLRKREGQVLARFNLTHDEDGALAYLTSLAR